MNQRKNFIFDQVLFHALSVREAAWPSNQWNGLSKSRHPKLKLFPGCHKFNPLVCKIINWFASRQMEF